MNLFRFTTVATSAAITPPPPPPEFIRGGRLRKTSKGLISFAPFLAGASALALGALLATASPVEAGSCATAGQPAGTARCADGADVSDSTEELEAPENSSFTVTDADGFGLNVQVANMKGIVITTKATTTDLSVDLDGNVGATDTALDIDMDGTGATTVTTDGTLTSTAGKGLATDVASSATGAITITTGGAINTEDVGVELYQNGTGATTVTTNGDITSTAKSAVYVKVLRHTAGSVEVATGNVEVNVNGDASSGEGAAVNVLNQGTGETIVTTGADSVARVNTTSVGFSTVYVSNGILRNDSLNRANRDGHVKATLNGDIGSSSSSANGGATIANRGWGNLTVEVNGDIFASGERTRGLYALHGGSGSVDVTVGSGSTIKGEEHGVRVSHGSSNQVEVGDVIGVTINGTVEGGVGVLVSNSHALQISTTTIGGSVTGTDGTALDLDGVAAHNVTLQSGSTLTGKIDASGATGAVNLDISGTVTVTSGDAIELAGAAAHTITVGTGGTVTGTIDVSAAAGGTTLDISGAVNPTSGNALELGGAANHTVILREGANIQGRIEKISGATGNVEFRIEGDISENPLVWVDTFDEASRPGRNTFLGFGSGDSILIADGARVQPGEPRRAVPGEDIHSGLNNTPVNLAGRLVFSGLFDGRQAFFSTLNGRRGGAVEIDLDFSRGDRERTSARFSATNLTGSTENISVHIRAVGGLRGLLNEDGEVDAAYDTDGDGAITITKVIESLTLGTLGANHFVAGDWLDNEVDDGDWELALVYDNSNFQSVWSVVARPRQQNRPGTGGGPGGPVVLAGPATLFDTLPMVLAHLGQPESMHRRTQNRSFQPSTGVWGKVQTRRLSVEPSAASFESDIHNVTFGVQAPIHTVTLGADVTLQTAETEAVIADGKQDIETNALIAGLAATWERDDLYVDGQFQYARFDNDLNAADGTKLASPTTDSFSAGVEVGYVLDAGNLKLGKWLGRGVLSNILVTPSAQVSWSQIGFSDFVAADGKTVSLDDGTVINGRVGIMAETLWESVVLHEAFAPASVRLQGSADVVVPLDGEVVTQVDGANQISELEDPVLDVGIGVFYTWELGGHAYTLSGDISSRQGSEVEGYEGSLGFKYRF